jgi:hypothetical protein
VGWGVRKANGKVSRGRVGTDQVKAVEALEASSRRVTMRLLPTPVRQLKMATGSEVQVAFTSLHSASLQRWIEVKRKGHERLAHATRGM